MRRRLRRIATILTSLAFVQLTVLGNSLACPTMSAEVSHAEHGDQSATGTDAEHGAKHAPSHDGQSQPDCAVRACTNSTVAIPTRVIELDAADPLETLDWEPGGAPASLLPSLDPPPPRA